ncbi:MAG: hypothetical protein ACYCW6_00510 [Candidatus Xenobia bacterium]
MTYIVLTEQGNFLEWRDEAHPPEPGDWMMGEAAPEMVELVAEGPDAPPLDEWWPEFVRELESIKRQMVN